jgi:hypothetical protein
VLHPVLQLISKILSSARRAFPDHKSILFAAAFALVCRQSICAAAELGSPAPDFSLKSLAGPTRGPAPPPKDTLLILYFFDPSEQAIRELVRLDDAVSRSSGALSLLAVAGGNLDKLKASLAGQATLYPLVLNDTEGVTIAYGFRGKLPAAVILGPGARIGAILAPAPSADRILMSSADTFLSLQLPGQAGRVYGAMPADTPMRANVELGKGYASMLTGDTTAVQSKLKPLAGGAPPLSFEAHAALGFLAYRLGRDNAARAACNRASESGFAKHVMGMINARNGECKESARLFDSAAKGRFSFKWQKALALNMAARIAEERGDDQAALSSYKDAAALAPLNPTINANLLTYHRRHNTFPAASWYAEIIKSINPKDLLVKALVDEFEAETEFTGDSGYRKRLGQRLDANLKRDAKQQARAPEPLVTLVSDLTATDCPLELSSFQSAGAGLLGQTLESAGPFTAIPRHETLAAAARLRIPKKDLRKASNLLAMAKALSADLVTTGEVGTDSGEYFVNVRIAEAPSGDVIAVTSERFGLPEDLASAIKTSASRLKEKVSSRYGR